jgi:poly(3-hydroxybutyrate) depolymerase
MGLDGIRIEVGTRPGESTVPMLVYWHPSVSTSDDYSKYAAPVAAGVVAAGGVIVSFQGTTGGDLYSLTGTFGKGDLLLVDQLVACAVRDRGVDPRRIYTMGCSSGGFFAIAMAAQRSEYVAAVVANSGGWAVEVPFSSARAPALMTIHPRPGITQPIDFGTTSADVDKAFGARGGFVVDCQTPGGVCDYTLNDGAWAFLQAHPFGVLPEPWASGLPAGFPPECKMP